MTILLTFFSNFSYLWYPIPAALLLIAVRTVFEKWVFRPLGTALGLRPTPHRRPPTNDVIEAEFRASEKGVLKEEVDLKLAQQTGLSERQVWPLTRIFFQFTFFLKKIWIFLEGKSLAPNWKDYCSLLFHPASPLSWTPPPTLPCTLLPELLRYKGPVSCATLSPEVPGQCQNQLP